MYSPKTCEVVVDHVPPPLPPPPEPQALAAKEMRPLLSVWRHLVPEPEREPILIDEAYKLVVVALVPIRSVRVALEANKLVEVAWEVVEFMPVKFWRVVEPLRSRLARVPRPEEVMLPALKVPA